MTASNPPGSEDRARGTRIPLAALEHMGAVANALAQAIVSPDTGEPDACPAATAALQGALCAAFDDVVSFELGLGPEGFRFGGTLLGRPDPRQIEITGRIHADGVRSLTFARGIYAAEVSRLIDALASPPAGSHQSDEDTVTRLWAADLPHVSYTAEAAIGSPAEPEAPRHALITLLNDRIVSRVRDLARCDATPRPPSAPGSSSAAGAAGTAPGDAPAMPLRVPESVLERIRQEAREDEGGRLARRAMDILLDLVREQECALHVDTLCRAADGILRAGRREGGLATVNVSLERLCRSRGPDLEGPVARFLDALLQHLASDEALDSLLETVRPDDGPACDALRGYLLRLPASALAAVARRAKECPRGLEREVLGNLILSRGWQHPDLLADYLRDGDAEEAIRALRAIRPTYGLHGVERVLVELVRHGDDRVRTEAVLAVRALSDLGRARLLEAPLWDRSRSVRLAAIRIIEETRVRPLRRSIAAVLDEGVDHPEERLRLLHAIAVLGGPPSVACLQKHLGPRRSFLVPFRRDAPFRQEVIVSLHDVEDPGVRSYLVRGRESRDRSFAAACRKALAMGEEETGQG